MTKHRQRTQAGTSPKRILALDGGGIRGAVAIAFLERMERLLEEERPGVKVRLCDYFDLIGGTSTGAIIAVALGLGYRVAEILDFYKQLAPRVFRRSFWRIIGLQTVFDSRILKTEILRIVGDRTLDTPDLLTKIAIMTKRIDTGSPWIICNQPNSKFWDRPPDRNRLGNRNYPLANLIRASTAAPHYFAPEPIEIISGEQRGLFVDGGVSPFNNPSLALIMAASLPAFGFNWPLGAENLHLVSIGTGSFRMTLDATKVERMTAAGLAIRALSGMIIDSEAQTLALLQWLGRTDTPWSINSEIGMVEGGPGSTNPLFRFERYDVMLEVRWLREALGLDVTARDIELLRRMDDASQVARLYEIGKIAAERQIKPEHLASPR